MPQYPWLVCFKAIALFLSPSLIFKNYLFIYLREREWENTEGEGKGEAGSLLSQEPDVGLDPRTPGPWPEPKAVA